MEDVKKNVLNTGIMNILAMVLLYIVAHFFLRGFQLDTHTFSGALLTLVFGCIPAFLWLSFFYFLDRKDPEPLYMVFIAFLAGILGEVVFSGFIGDILFNIRIWNLNANALPLAYLLFAQGFIPAISIYIVLRYFFYPSKNFNEPVDGMMYGAFIGTGYALMLALKDVFGGGFISLYYLVFALLIRLALVSSLGALVGYYFGIARFDEKRKQIYFLVAAVISFGVFSLYAWIQSLFSANLATNSDIVSLIIVLAFTLVILAIVFFLIQRTIKKGEAQELEGGKFTVDLVSVITIVILIIAGISIRLVKEGDMNFSDKGNKVSFTVPSEYKYIESQSKKDQYVFTKNEVDERYPVNLAVSLTRDYSPSSLQNLSVKGDTSFKVNDYSVNFEIRQELITMKQELKKDLKNLQGMGDKFKLPVNMQDSKSNTQSEAYMGTIYEYAAEKEGLKIDISIEFPGPDFPEPRELVRKIISSLKI